MPTSFPSMEKVCLDINKDFEINKDFPKINFPKLTKTH